MGTRSLTVPMTEDGNEIVVMYRQMDGYPSGIGQELADFLSPITLVNGIGGETRPIANGMDCLAAQIVAHFKEGPGSIYLYPAGTNDVGEEYIYTVYPKDGKIFLKCVDAYAGQILYDGVPKDFDGTEIERKRNDDEDG